MQRTPLKLPGEATSRAAVQAVAEPSCDGLCDVRAAESSAVMQRGLGLASASQLPALQQPSAGPRSAVDGSLSSARDISSAQLALALRLAAPAQLTALVAHSMPGPLARRTTLRKLTAASLPPLGLGPGSGLLSAKSVGQACALSEVRG